MKTRSLCRLLAVALVVIPGVRLLADRDAEDTAIWTRRFCLDLTAKNAAEASARERARTARQVLPAMPPEFSAVNFDLHKLGKLDDKEFATWTSALRRSVSQSPAAMNRFDTNHDGRLDDAEWSVALRRLLSGT